MIQKRNRNGIVRGLAVVCLSALFAFVCRTTFGSLTFGMSLREVGGTISAAIRVAVVTLKVEPVHQILPDGSQGRLLAHRTEMECDVRECALGAKAGGRIRIVYTRNFPVPHEDPEYGVIHFSPIVPESGLEYQLAAGQEYWFCFSHFDAAAAEHHLMRAEPADRGQAILDAVFEAAAWKWFAAAQPDLLAKIGVATYDPASRSLILWHREDSRLFRVNGETGASFVYAQLTAGIAVNQLVVEDGKTVVLLRNGDTVSHVAFAAFAKIP